MSDTSTGTQVQDLDPRALLVDVNVRRDLRVDQEFTASIRDNGVLVPIVAVRTTDGDIRVRFGHRRTLAAIEAGKLTVPVIVVADEAADPAAQVERLVGQYAENEHRTGLSNAEQVDVMAQLSAFGVSAAQIAKRTRTKRERVDAALVVAGSPLAAATTAQYDFLDLTQAAAVAEFEDDPEAVTALVTAAQRGQFAHTVQRLRDARAEAQRRDGFATTLRATGVTVIDRPAHDSPVKALSSLVTDDGAELTAARHAGCPGHAAYVGTAWGYTDPVTGEPVDDPDTEDEDDTDLLEAEGDAGDREDDQDGAGDDEAVLRPVWGQVLVAVYVCTDPAANGHQPRYRNFDAGTERPKLADMTDEQREAARAERRDVLESNKAWRSAETVRRDWLRAYLTRKTPPKGGAAFVATALACDADTATRIGGNHLTAELLGHAPTSYGRNTTLADAITEATEARAGVLGLALILGGYEDATHIGSWRNVDPGTRRYLTFLAGCGYTLSDVERRACGQQPLPADPGPEPND